VPELITEYTHTKEAMQTIFGKYPVRISARKLPITNKVFYISLFHRAF